MRPAGLVLAVYALFVGLWLHHAFPPPPPPPVPGVPATLRPARWWGRCQLQIGRTRLRMTRVELERRGFRAGCGGCCYQTADCRVYISSTVQGILATTLRCPDGRVQAGDDLFQVLAVLGPPDPEVSSPSLLCYRDLELYVLLHDGKVFRVQTGWVH